MGPERSPQGLATYDAQRSRNVGQDVSTKAVHPDFLIKYEPVNEPCPPGGCEESLVGTESDAVAMVQALIEAGRTTPGRVRIYANTEVSIGVAVVFPKNPAR